MSLFRLGHLFLAGYLFTATRGIADRFVGKLIGLTIFTLLIDIVLSIIINGDAAYFNVQHGKFQCCEYGGNGNYLHPISGLSDAGKFDLCFLPAVASLSRRRSFRQSVEHGRVSDAGGARGANGPRWRTVKSGRA